MAGQWVIEDEPAPAGKWVIEDSAPSSSPMSRTAKVVKGLRDPIDGGAQLLTNILPDAVVRSGNTANNWLADKTGLVSRLPEGGVDQQVREGEKAYQEARAQAGETGLDGYRLAGNLASPANLALASRLPLGSTMLSRVGIGAAGGAASAALSPVAGDGDYKTEKGTQLAVGALSGGLIPAATGAVARAISPKASTNAQLALLKSEGVKPTVGQSLGGWANRLEEKLQSVPFFGDSVSAARQRSGVDLSRAAANRALFPIGKSLPKDVNGNDAVLYVRKAMNEAYDDIAPKLGVQQDKIFQQSIASLKSGVKSGAINPNARKAFDRFLSDEVNPLFQGQQSMSGETFKRLQSKITEKIQQTSASTDADQRLLSGAYKEMGEQLNQLAIRTNPKAAERLKAINTGYANFKRLQKAASSVAAEDGNFTPAMLHNAVKAADRSKDKARFAEGGALMQDLSSAGKTLLSNKVPNSGTADRLMLGGGLAGTAWLNPAVALAAGGGLLTGSALYTPAAQRALSGFVSSRPEFAQPAAEMLRKTAPALVPGGAQFGLGLLNQ